MKISKLLITAAAAISMAGAISVAYSQAPQGNLPRGADPRDVNPGNMKQDVPAPKMAPRPQVQSQPAPAPAYVQPAPRVDPAPAPQPSVATVYREPVRAPKADRN